ncbi:hypothetical protein NGM37_51365, partial [Streptomyces sp. TRM76130]|nr:hypothetical protein [Streptomyces sp. TRM76130]
MTEHPSPRTVAPVTPDGEEDEARWDAPAADDGTGPARDATLWAATLLRQLPDLVDELAPSSGSRRTTARHAPGPAERAARAALLRTEREEALRNEQEHGLAVPGHSAAPVRLHVS